MILFRHDDPALFDLSTLIGAKAANLKSLEALGCIPEWFALSGQAFLQSLEPAARAEFEAGQTVDAPTVNPTFAALLKRTLRELGDEDTLWAVRSSAIGEDGDTQSFAGQLSSFLNVRPAFVVDHVQKVWASALKDHVAAYQGENAKRLIPAVLIQKMVKADVAGVAFGCDPVSGDKSKVVVSAIEGLGDRLVGGEENGHTYRFAKSEAPSGDDLLSSDALMALRELLKKVESHYQKPMDIEWAFEAGKLYLLQARPVTSLKAELSECAVVWDNSNIVESYSGVTAPLTFSFARYVYAHVYQDFCALMGVSKARIESERKRFWQTLGYVKGHVYYNLNSWYALLALFPGFASNRAFMEQMMGVKTPMPEAIVKRLVPQNISGWARFKDRLSLMKTAFGLAGAALRLKQTQINFYKRLNAALNQPIPTDLMALNADYRRLEKSLLARWDAPLINDFLTMIAFGVSRKLMETYAGAKGLLFHADMMIGQGDIISAEPARQMRKMAQLIAHDSHAISAFADYDRDGLELVYHRYPDLKVRIETYLSTFSDRCLQELKLESPTLADDPAILFRTVGQMARFAKEAEDEPEINTPELSHIIGLNPLRNLWAGLWLKWAKAGVRNRENLRFERTRVFGRVRKIFLHIGRQLVEANRLNQADDIFMLEAEEVMGFIEGNLTTPDLKSLVAIRRASFEAQKSEPAPPERFITETALHEAIQSGLEPDLPSGQTPPLNDNQRQGLGCCRGKVYARVRVITDPRQQTLEAGEIMVARFTDPGWIMLFVNAAGILVERGSLLSHSAIVAREMNIPAIVAVDGIMEWLKDGDRVEMDGATGLITRL